jgi:hypothetical protein
MPSPTAAPTMPAANNSLTFETMLARAALDDAPCTAPKSIS